MIEGKVIYSGIDWLTLGIYAEPKEDIWGKKIEELKKVIGSEIKELPFRYEILTSKKLAEQHYTIMIRELKYNIAIKITREPRREKIEQVKKGYIKMPDFLVEIPAKALRPQNIYYTENFIKNIINMFAKNIYAFIYSRIDFNTDIYDTSEEFREKILNMFNARKKKINALEYSETEINKEIWSIKKGTSGYKELSIYRTTKRDTELIQIYNQELNDTISKEELKLIWRFELRISRKYLRLHKDYEISKIQKIKHLDIKRIIYNAYKIFEEDKNTIQFKELFKEQKHPQIEGYYKRNSTIEIKQTEINTEELYKIALGIFNKAYELLKNEYKYLNAEDIFNHFFKAISKMKSYIKDKAEEGKEFFKILKESIKYIKDFAITTFKKEKFLLEDEIINFEEIEYKKVKRKAKNKRLFEKFGGVAPKTQKSKDEIIGEIIADFI